MSAELLRILGQRNPYLQGLGVNDVNSVLAPRFRIPGSRIVSDDTKLKSATTRAKNLAEKLDKFTLSLGTMPNVELGGRATVQITALLTGLMDVLPNLKFAIQDNMFLYINEQGKPSSNWAKIRQKLSKANPWYFSPLWRLIQGYNKMASGVNQQKMLEDRKISYDDLRNRAVASAIKRGRYISRGLRNNDAFRNTWYGNVDTRAAAANTRIASRREYLDALASINL